MKPFVYILTEGVLDIVVLTSVLTRSFEFALLKQKSTLPECFAGWLDAFKWPTGDDITRRAVPAPVFLESDRLLVGIRSAQGIDNMSRTLSIDREVFSRRERQQPVVIGIVLDADDEEPQKRLKKFAELVVSAGFPQPLSLDQVIDGGGKRSGIFAFPGGGLSGTIEDSLLPLAQRRFPQLHQFVSPYVAEWCQTTLANESKDYAELRKPSGPLKATLSSMVAFLKPAKPLNASIEDHNWLPLNPRTCTELQPLVQFLENLLAPVPVVESQKGSMPI
jgi:hypothetical protein